MGGLVQFNDEWKELVILKLNYLGYKRVISELNVDLGSILDWLCKKYNFSYSPVKFTIDGASIITYALFYNNTLVNRFFVNDIEGNEIYIVLISEILKFWKCIDGNLQGPELSFYITPQDDWT